MADPLAMIKAEIMAQPEAERLEYAIDVLRYYLDPLPEFVQGCGGLGLGLALRDLRLLHALDRRRGQYVSIDALASAQGYDQPADEIATHDAVFRRVATLRRQIDRARLPVSIDGWREVGYRLDAPAGFRFEAGAAALGVRQ